MKKLGLCILIFVSVFFTGCFNYRDINKAYFVTATFLDVDNDGNIIVYEEAFKPTRGGGAKGSSSGSDQGQRIVFKGVGKTVFEAIRDINTMSSYKLNFTQNRAIILTQRLAEYGINNIIDFFERDQELINRAYLAVYVGDIDKLLAVNLKEEEYVGLFVPTLIRNVGSSSRTVELQLNDFVVKRLQPSRTTVVTILMLETSPLGEKLKIKGGAIIKNDRMIGTLDSREGQGYNFLNNQIKTGTLEITNPDDQTKYVTLEILKNSTKTELTYNNKEQVNLKKMIKTKATLGEVQNKLNFTKENLEKIQKTAEQNIMRACNQVFNKYKNQGIDIFDVENSFYRKYPYITFPDIIKRTYLDVEVEVEIEGSSDTMDFH